MKELSIEQKARRYDEAIEVARKIKNGEPINVPDGTLIPVAIFPELRESEDEKIRKELIDIVKKSPITFAFKDKWKVLAWLEKQVQKPQCKSALEASKEEKVDNANKVEPKDYSSIDPHFFKPAWSEEDDVAVKDICDKLNRLSMTYVGNESIVCQEEIKWLKSLSPQPHWKPSDEQMDMLKIAVSTSNSIVLDSLYNDLEKLKG